MSDESGLLFDDLVPGAEDVAVIARHRGRGVRAFMRLPDGRVVEMPAKWEVRYTGARPPEPNEMIGLSLHVGWTKAEWRRAKAEEAE